MWSGLFCARLAFGALLVLGMVYRSQRGRASSFSSAFFLLNILFNPVMKKPLLLLAAMAFATASFAQTATTTQLPTHRVHRMGQGTPKTPEQRADHHTAMLTKKLALTADQQPKVRQILLAQAQEGQALRAKYPAKEQRQAHRQEMKAGRAKYQAQLQAVLSPDQYGKLTAMHKEHHYKGGHGGKQPAKS
jgi:protein CpxP